MAITTRELLLVLRARDEAAKVLRSNAAAISGVSAAAAAAAQKQIQQGAAMTTVGVAAAYAGVQAIQFLNDATDAAIEYNRQSALTLTQVDQLGVKLSTIKDIGRDVAGRIPVDFKTIQDSLYDIFSSMDVSVPEAKMLLEEFSKAAVAGQVDLQDASRATIGILNAYGLKAKDVTHINDVMFELVRKGVGTYGEFATTIGRAVPSAVRAGQSVESLAGMLAFLTRNGLSAAMASASAARALDAISHPKTIEHFESLGKTIAKAIGEKAAIKRFGKDYKDLSINIRDASGNIRPMSAIMTDLGKAIGGLPKADRAAVLYQLFKSSGGTIQARRFFDIAVERYKELGSLTNDMIDSVGAMDEAYNTMYDQSTSKLQLLSNRWEILKTKIGDILVPIKDFITSIGIDLLGAFNNLNPTAQQTIVYFIGISAVVAVIIGVIIALTGAFLMLSGAAALAGTSIAAVMAPVSLIVVGILLLGAAILAVWKYHDKLWAKAKEVWNAIYPYIEPYVNGIKKLLSAFKDLIVQGFERAWKTLKESLKPALDTLRQTWDQLQPTLQRTWNELKKLEPILKIIGIVIGVVVVAAIAAVIAAFILVVNFIAGILGPTIEALAKVFQAAVKVITGVINLVIDLIHGDFEAAWEDAKQIVSGIWDAIVAVVKGAIGIVVGAIKGLWNGVVAVFQWAKDVLVGHSIVPEMIQLIVTLFVALPGRILSAIASLGGRLASWAANAMRSGYNSIVTWAGTIVSYIGGLPGRIISAISSLGSRLYTAGWNAMVNLYNGLVGMGEKALGYVRSIAGKIRDLWPFSPAKSGPLRQYPLDKAGANMMKMLAHGINSNKDLVLGSMKRVAYDVSQTQPGTPVVPGRGGTPGPGGNGMGGGNTYQDFYITTQEIDPAKHAADLGWEIARRRG